MAAKKPVVRFEEMPLVRCAFMMCEVPAITRIRTRLGWANYCQRHYGEYHLRLAEEKCHSLGLETLEAKREHVRQHLKAIAQKWRTPDE